MFEKFRSARSGVEVKNAFDAANSVEQGKALEHSINQNTALIEGAAALRQDARDAGEIADGLRRRMEADSEQADDIIAELRREKIQAIRERNAAIEDANFYKNLLSQPISEISATHPGFRATYEQQQTVLDAWKVSQKAYRQLALELSETLGLDEAEFKKRYEAAETGILESKPSAST